MCVEGCDTGYFFVEKQDSTRLCVACNELCASCKGPTASDCVTCAPGSGFSGKTCV